MAKRSWNYIVIRPHVAVPAHISILLNDGPTERLADHRGSLVVYESDFEPMFARDERNDARVPEIEREVAVHKFLDTLPANSFFMRRVGWEYDFRGSWSDHPFLSEEKVTDIEKDFREYVELSATGCSEEEAKLTIGTQPARRSDATQRAMAAIQHALSTHKQALFLEGDTETQIWHLLLSLSEFCAFKGIDLDAVLVEVRETMLSGELAIPAWEAWADTQVKAGRLPTVLPIKRR
jgi:hypothetical protein